MSQVRRRVGDHAASEQTAGSNSTDDVALPLQADEFRSDLADGARMGCWLFDNLEALQSSNEFVEKFGLPLARYRMF